MTTPTAATVPWLVADIGGTNARFGRVLGSGQPVTDIRHLRAAGHAHLADAVRAYLASDSAAGAPRQACFAVATPLDGDAVAFTNSAWRFSRSALQRELGLDRLMLLNDFEALALSLPRLTPDGLRPHGVLPEPHGTLAVVGPGTGLGVGAVIETAIGWQAIPGEGGHATLAPGNDFEAEVLSAARHEVAHVSAERLLSGIGLPLLHRCVARAAGRVTDASGLTTEAIVQHGVEDHHAGRDSACVQTLSVFCAMLGAFAGNVALTVGARGGLYVGGGIVPRMSDFFFASDFRERFEAKGRYRDYLRAIPTALIVDPHAAMTGAALALEQAEVRSA